MLVTPTGFSKADATFESLVCMDMNGDVLEGNLKPASKRFMHLAMYRQHSGIDGVAHGPPAFATVFASSINELPVGVLPGLIATFGFIPTALYGRPSSPKLAAAVASFAN